MWKILGFRVEDIIFYILALNVNLTLWNQYYSLDRDAANKLSFLTLGMILMYFAKGFRK